jgi:Flp pilus assembly pilin Flp
MRYLRHFVRDRRGQTLIEFALLAPFVFIFLFTIVDFGIALDKRITLQHAVREGSRAAAVAADPDVGLHAALDQAQGIITEDDEAITVCYIDEPDEDGNRDGVPRAFDSAKVSVDYTYHYTIPFGSLLVGIGVFDEDQVRIGIDMNPSGTSALENDPAAGVTFEECVP